MLRLLKQYSELTKQLTAKLMEVNVKVDANAKAIVDNSKAITDIKANVTKYQQ